MKQDNPKYQEKDKDRHKKLYKNPSSKKRKEKKKLHFLQNLLIHRENSQTQMSSVLGSY